MNALTFRNVCEKYRIKFVRNGRASWEEFWALRDINLSVAKGEILGIVGENGSGKTTLLKLAAGMLSCDRGDCEVEGRIAALMELGAGFNPEFTGRENVLLNARTYGLRKDALDKCVCEIEAFADLGKFMDAPVKYYSQGMFMRLAFALAVFVDPDIFLIDDILSVGDERSQRKCVKKMFELKSHGKTMLIVSHDMHLIRQLCDRVIFIENGRISREGATDEIVSYYLECVGSKEGVAAIKDADTQVVFNNGNLSLRYKGELLTVTPGACVSLFLPDINYWCPSAVFQWRVKESSPSRIVAEGVYGENRMSQEWIMELKDGGFNWDVRIDGEGVRDSHIDMTLVSDYSGYRTLKAEGEFPAFSNKYEWQSLGLKDLPIGIVGFVPSKKPKGGKLKPFIIFAQDREPLPIQLFNSGYEVEARVAQFFFAKGHVSSLKVEFIEDEPGWNSLWKKRLCDLSVRWSSGDIQRLEKTMIRSNIFGLAIDDVRKKIRLFSADNEITAYDGFRNVMESSDKSLSFEDASWNVERDPEGNLILKLYFGESGIIQEWLFSVCAPGVFSVKAVLDIKRPLKIVKQSVLLGLKDMYGSWKTPFEAGTLRHQEDFVSDYPVRWKNNKAGSVGLYENNSTGVDHAFLFSVDSDHGARVMTLCKRKEEGREIVCLNNSLIVPSEAKGYGVGRSIFFDGKVSFPVSEPDLKAANYSGIVAEFKGDRFSFVFDNGCGRIFDRGKELTKDLGLYTSLCSRGVWIDSSQALWRVEEKAGQRIVVIGSWPFVPVEQKWEIGFIKENEFWWHVESRAVKDVPIEIEQASLMLSPIYRGWRADKRCCGDFPQEYTRNSDTIPYRSWYGNADEISASGDGYPEIAFIRKPDLNSFKGLVENTNCLYSARRLIFQKANEVSLNTGNYILFEGKIIVKD